MYVYLYLKTHLDKKHDEPLQWFLVYELLLSCTFLLRRKYCFMEIDKDQYLNNGFNAIDKPKEFAKKLMTKYIIIDLQFVINYRTAFIRAKPYLSVCNRVELVDFHNENKLG